MLIVETERGAATFARSALEADGAHVTVVRATAAATAVQASTYDLLAIVCLTSGCDAGTIVRVLRSQTTVVPIIVITPPASDDEVARWLEAGADDYVVASTSPTLLRARARARLRQVPREHTPSVRPDVREPAHALTYGGLGLDRATRRLHGPGGTVALTAQEYALLDYLMRHAGQIVARTRLLDHVWGYDFDPGTNVADVALSRLRRKLAGVTPHVRLRAVRRVGVVLETRDDAGAQGSAAPLRE